MSMPRIFAGRRRRLVGLLILNGLAQATAGFGVALSLRSLLHGAEHGALAWPTLVGMLALGLFVLVLRIREASDAEALGQDYVTRVRLRIFDRVALRPAGADGGARSGVTLARLTGDLNALRNWVSRGLARLIVSGISLIGLLASLFHFSRLAGLVVSGILIACGLVGAFALPRLRETVREARRRRGRLTNNLSEKVLAARAVWQLGRFGHERKRIHRHSRQLRDALVRRARWSALLRSGSEIVWPLAIVAVLASLVAAGRPASEMVVAVLLVGMIVTAMGRIARAVDDRVGFEEGRRRIEETFSMARLREAKKTEALPGHGPLQLELEDVVVAGRLLRSSLRAAPGERILLTGPSGSGKSTLLSLAARLQDPDEGEVRLDGVPIRKLALDALPAAVQLVSADSPLLRGTVAENVGYAVPGEDPAWLARVAETCGLVGDPGLEAGFETRVEEQGMNLSQGLRQRILLARAIAIRPRLLLVDEPGLLADPAGRSALEAALDLLGATVVVVGGEPDSRLRIDQVWRMPAARVESPAAPSNVVQGIRWSAGASARLD